MPGSDSHPPAALAPSEDPPEEKAGPGGNQPETTTMKDTGELPEGWEPLPLDPNFKNPTYRTYQYRGVTLISAHLDWNCMRQLAKFRSRPSDIIVASFPKSGTTWLMEIVWRVVHGELGAESGGGVPLEYRFPMLDFESVEDLMEMTNVHELPDPRLIKSHLPYHLLPKNVLTSGAKVLYVSRDPRDACVSSYHFSRMVEVMQYRGTFAQFRELFARGGTMYGPGRDHVRQYKEHSDTVLLVTYEQMHQDRAAVVRKVAAFLGRQLSEDQVEAIVRFTSFQVMKDNPATNFRQWEKTGLGAKDEGTFMRKGVAGDWRNYFTQEESDAFMAQLL